MEIEARLSPIDDALLLESEWRSLEISEHVSFFLSWDWIGPLLNALPKDSTPLLMRVQSGGRTLALGLFSIGKERRRRVINSRVLRLNETGVSEYDSITVEHNGLLTRDGFQRAAIEAAMRRLVRQDSWDELYLSGLRSDGQPDWTAAAQSLNLNYLERWEKPYHFVDLDQLRSTGSTYLDSLGSNTRYQIRRAMKLYQARGPLTLRQATSLTEALGWLLELSELHQVYWQARGLPGAFASDFARRFHNSVVRNGWPRNTVQIVKIVAGESVVGYAYNFRKGRVLYNYQTGMKSEEDSKLKPGLVCHALIAADACDKGLGTYDLLAGGSHYKRSLTNAEGRMTWAVVQKRRLVFGIENSLRVAHACYRRGLKSIR